MTFANLMICLTAGGSNDTVLRFAADVAAQVRTTRLIGVGACQPFQIYASPDGFVPADLIQQDLEQIDKELKAAEITFRSALEGKAKNIEWRSTAVTYGSIADYVAEQMRAADLLLISAEQEISMFDNRHVNLADLVLKAGKPVLVSGPAVEKLDLKSVILGWKDSREARRAAEDALPILKLAGRVTVVEIAAKDDLDEAHARTEDVTTWLASHGVAASACPIQAGRDDPAEIEAVAKQLGAGLVVGGAYGHTRMREWVLGGVTRDLLLCPRTRCSLISH